MKVLISSGSDKFQLIPLAAELDKKNQLDINVFTSAYPRNNEIKFLRLLNLSKFKIIDRFIERKENIAQSKVEDYRISEILLKVANLFKNNLKLKNYFRKLGLVQYSSKIKISIKKKLPEIYHFRCQYGLDSVGYSKKFNIVQICDHSIAHPLFLYNQLFSKIKYLNPLEISNDESFDFNKLPLELRKQYEDIHNAENILVNSDFVKKTLIHYGIPSSRVKVIYWGCDDKFLSYNKKFSKKRYPKKKFIYAGTWCERKGVNYLAEALIDLREEVELTVAGANIEEIYEITPALKNSKLSLKVLGYISRKELSRVLCKHKIFIFPSLCEGSARVIFEAMASGCCILTTNNSGSIVKDNEHGFIFKEGNVESLKKSIRKIILKTDKEIEEIGFKNFTLVRECFNQQVYGDKVSEYYQTLLQKKYKF